MAWTNSKIFSATIEAMFENTIALDVDSDTLNAALFDNSITPSQTVALASTAYGAGVWAGGGVSDVTGWPAIGRPLVPTSGFSSNVYTYDSADTVSVNDTTTLTNAYGCLVYDDTIASDYGLCYNYFGGANSVTSGRFTIIWNTAGVLALTL